MQEKIPMQHCGADDAHSSSDVEDVLADAIGPGLVTIETLAAEAMFEADAWQHWHDQLNGVDDDDDDDEGGDEANDGIAAPFGDETFAEYMWMLNEEEFDKEEMQRLEEEALMEQCIEAMFELDRVHRRAAGDAAPPGPQLFLFEGGGLGDDIDADDDEYDVDFDELVEEMEREHGVAAAAAAAAAASAAAVAVPVAVDDVAQQVPHALCKVLSMLQLNNDPAVASLLNPLAQEFVPTTTVVAVTASVGDQLT